MKPWNKRQGVWVESDEGVGIRTFEVKKLSRGGEIEIGYVDLVGEDGVTIAAAVPEQSLTNVRIARASSIPRCRVEHLTVAQLAQMGYV